MASRNTSTPLCFCWTVCKKWKDFTCCPKGIPEVLNINNTVVTAQSLLEEQSQFGYNQQPGAVNRHRSRPERCQQWRISTILDVDHEPTPATAAGPRWNGHWTGINKMRSLQHLLTSHTHNFLEHVIFADCFESTFLNTTHLQSEVQPRI